MASNVITSEPRMLPDSWQRARAEWQVTGKLHPLPAPGQVHTGRLGKEAQGGPRGALLRRRGSHQGEGREAGLLLDKEAQPPHPSLPPSLLPQGLQAWEVFKLCSQSLCWNNSQT